MEPAFVVATALDGLSVSGRPKTNSFKFFAQRIYRKRIKIWEFSGV